MKMKRFSLNKILNIISISLLMFNLLFGVLYINVIFQSLVQSEHSGHQLFSALVFGLMLLNIYLILAFFKKYKKRITLGFVFWGVQSVGVSMPNLTYYLTSGISIFSNISIADNFILMINWYALFAYIVLCVQRVIKTNI